MTLEEMLTAILHEQGTQGDRPEPPATEEERLLFEQRLGFELPIDFLEFYQLCNGFETGEDLFHFFSINDILARYTNHGGSWFYFAEYMAYSDLWGVRVFSKEEYLIFNVSDRTILTHSLREFLDHFRQGGVFEKGGLYDWPNYHLPGRTDSKKTDEPGSK